MSTLPVPGPATLLGSVLDLDPLPAAPAVVGLYLAVDDEHPKRNGENRFSPPL